ncbi:PIN domain-containing protein [Piscicoccus intestinalis]|uniref:PIN domain-containing protein n=1 Tax=Piscicoccus intestinalis TaxID=746033 RepID=UPI001FE04503|nr:PIN domain-containing protein [Piscicoccus intestinalis]
MSRDEAAMSSDPVACDASVAVPLLVQTHEAHDRVAAWARGRDLALVGHALVETYSVLTRLPAGIRLEPDDAAAVIDANFTVMDAAAREGADAHRRLAAAGIAGGASYDGIVAMAAADAGLGLATRDQRARGTYDVVGVRVIIAD